jgi:hypothetical protein
MEGGGGGEEEVDDNDDDKDFNLCFINKISILKSNLVVLPNEDSNRSKLCYFYNYIHK